MSSYVNLLNAAEIQYHSAARDNPRVKFFLVAVVAAVGIFLATRILSFNQVTSKARRLEASWQGQEGAYEEALERVKKLGEADRRLAELKRWEMGRLPATSMLLALAELIPADVQLVELDVQYPLGFPLKGAAPLPPPPGKKKKDGDAAHSNLKRQGQVVIRGRVDSAAGETRVFELVEQLKNNAFLGKLFANVRLQSTTEETLPIETPDTPPRRVTLFTIECEMKAKDIS